ncbi:hypothetical protein [Pararobbsia alpina]|uniref:Uncharacterized protein n=1 Tax=Pararobbsia alpina TaxID=621374 RepID=A0A6S7CI63_9BURK|nr:hypothetical protein [Pararobbsia alpina]CAB3780691.1 hypothetical protein LMG28138_01098 [Pararobbsia alpina]
MAKPVADLAALQILAGQYAGRTYGKVLSEVLAYVDAVETWKEVPTGGSIVPFQRQGGSRYICEYQKGNLANIVHELTHIAVYEGYGNDMLNYLPTAKDANKPAAVLGTGGYVSNLSLRQLPDNAAMAPLEATMQGIAALCAGSNMGKAHKEMVQVKTTYAATLPHLEFDTCINHILAYMVGWGYPKTISFIKTKIGSSHFGSANALFSQVERVALQRHQLRTGQAVTG